MKEKDAQRLIETCERKLTELLGVLDAKNAEIERLKQAKVNSIRDYKNQAVQQIECLMEQLLDKDVLVEVNAFS